MTIVVILSLVSWPIYRSYHLREVSMLGEGYALIGSVKDAQIHYYNEYGNFLCAYNAYSTAANYENGGVAAAYTSVDPVLGINVMNNRYFSRFNYDADKYTAQKWKYMFVARVIGNLGNNKTVTMTLPFNLTERGALSVSGDGTTTVTQWNH